MTSLQNTQRPEAHYLEAVLADVLNGRSEEKFTADYLAGVGRCLIADPRYYRSFGPWWWALKTLLVENGNSAAGDQIDEDIADTYQYERPALTIVAAYLYQQMRMENGLLYSSSHQLPVPESLDDEPYDFVSCDLELESKVIKKE